MASALYFELYEGGSLTKNTFDVYLDSSSDAVENSYYYNDATFTPQLLNGTNGFSAWTGNAVVSGANRYRIRISYQDSLRFCSAWFKWSTNGYADYIPYYGTNGPSNGLYRIAVASNSFPTSRVLSGTTTLENIPSIKKTIPCSIYGFWGGKYLSGGTTYRPIIAMTTVNIGSEYSMRLPSSTNNPTVKNNITCCFYQHNPTNPEKESSYFNSYALDGPEMCETLPTGLTAAYNLSFWPKTGVICTGKMAESISYYAKEFDDNQCIPPSKLSSNGFSSLETDSCLPRFSSVQKNCSIILNTVFLTSGAVGNMKYVFSGNSKSFSTAITPTFPAASAVTNCYWKARIANFLDIAYNNTDLNESVTVTIGGAVTAATYAGWHYKVVASNRDVIKSSSPLSRGTTFTTTMKKLDGAVVFFSKRPNINNRDWTDAEKAMDGVHNIASTTYVYSWK